MSDELDRALDQLARDRSPAGDAAQLDDEERRMLRMAQLISGTRGAEVHAEFADSLRERVTGPGRRVSRRTAFVSGITALAAGVLGGIGIDRAVRGEGPSLPSVMVPNDGEWVAVAHASEMPEGAVRPFTAGAVKGFLINHGGEYRALSRICTHMGCVLRFEGPDQAFVCPCHGAIFNMQGKYLSGPASYVYPLRPLPRIEVRRQGDAIEVRGA